MEFKVNAKTEALDSIHRLASFTADQIDLFRRNHKVGIKTSRALKDQMAKLQSAAHDIKMIADGLCD